MFLMLLIAIKKLIISANNFILEFLSCCFQIKNPPTIIVFNLIKYLIIKLSFIPFIDYYFINIKLIIKLLIKNRFLFITIIYNNPIKPI